MIVQRNGELVELSEVESALYERTAAKAFNDRKSLLQSERDERIYSGTIQTTVAPVDLRHERDQHNLVARHSIASSALGQPITLRFRDANNENHQLTPEQMVSMIGQVFQHADAVWKRYSEQADELRAILDDQTLTEQQRRDALDAYEWTDE